MPTAMILLTLSVFLGTLKNILSRVYSGFSYPSRYIHAFNFLSFAAAAGTVYLCAIGTGTAISTFTLITAFLYAVLTIIAQISYIRAVKVGSVALSSLFYSCGFIVPTVLGTVIWHEKISAFQIAGFVLLLLSFSLSVPLKREKSEKRWLLFSLCALLSSGFVGLLQKAFRMSEYKNELNGFLTISFLLMTMLSAFIFMFFSMKEEKKLSLKLPGKRLLFTAVLMGLCIGLANKINLYLSGVLPSMIFFPSVNGGCIILSGAASYLIFRERLSTKKCLGIAVGIVSIILIGIKP